jgi:hypothetical protein
MISSKKWKKRKPSSSAESDSSRKDSSRDSEEDEKTPTVTRKQSTPLRAMLASKIGTMNSHLLMMFSNTGWGR